MLFRSLRVGEPRADLARVAQLAVGVVVAGEERADAVFAPSLAGHPTAHDELLAQLVLDLAPRGRTPAGRARLAFGLALLAIVVHSLFYNALIEDPLFWALLALSAVAYRLPEAERG